MRAIIGETIERIANIAVESASFLGLYEPDIPAESYKCDIVKEDNMQEKK